MATLDIVWNPTDRQLRQFGIAALIALPLLGWFFSGKPGPATWNSTHSLTIGGLLLIGGAMTLTGWIRPQLLRPLFLGATLAAYPIGLVLAEVILLAIYTLVFVPFALVFRLMGRDALERAVDRKKGSYWQPKESPGDAASYYRQS